eukprot:TRINITY_DN65017_c0_g1_i1.p1 TRINITY_DN65017_c0_g1~~TRINITY_DN65017_c0_g1_i1.p1  ORF type:complete len:450 (+),score=89.53 TRINITY_DN65017_c0_g1_i1:28-1377(+)
MDLEYLHFLGLIPCISALPADEEESPLDVHFPTEGSGTSKTYAQRLFNLPHRPDNISDFEGLLHWLEHQEARPVELVGIHGKIASVPDVARLKKAADLNGCSASTLGKAVHDAIDAVRGFFAESSLCHSLMLGDETWKPNQLESIFRHKLAPKPKAICAGSRHSKLNWKTEYDGRVLLSIDMREANFSSLRVMARLVDPALHERLAEGWIPLLDSLLGEQAEPMTSSKPLRELVLGGVERAWLRKQPDLFRVHGIDEAVRSFDGKSLFQRAKGDTVGTPEEDKRCKAAVKLLQGRISAAFTEVEHLLVEQAADIVSWRLQLKPFAFIGDEVVFLLETSSTSESDAAAIAVSQLLPEVFVDAYTDVASFFRVETMFVNDLKSVGKAPQHHSMLSFARRVLPSGAVEAFPMLKGAYDAGTICDTVREVRKLRGVEWDTWLQSSTSAADRKA